MWAAFQPMAQKINELEAKIAESDAKIQSLMQGTQDNLGRAIEGMAKSQSQAKAQAAGNPAGEPEEAEAVPPQSPKPNTAQMLIIQNAFNTLKLIFPNAKDPEIKGYIGNVYHAPDTDTIVHTHTLDLLRTGACTPQELQDKRLTSLLKSIATCPQREPYNFRRKLNALIDQWLEEKKK